MAAKGKTYDTHAIGRRKTAVARVYMAAGSGKITINKRDLKNFIDLPSMIVEYQGYILVRLIED